MRIRAASLALLAAAASGCDFPPRPTAGQDLAPRKGADKLVRVTALADADRVEPGGTFHLSFLFAIEPGWHIYWKYPGDSGMATRITVKAPEGYRVGDILWPRPRAFVTPALTTYGYEDRVALFVPVTAPKDPGAGPAAFEADISFLVCREACLLGRAKKTVTLPAPASHAPSAADRQTVESFRKSLPRPLDEATGATASFDGRTLAVAGPARGRETATFFPINGPGVVIGPAATEVRDGRFRIEAPVNVRPGDALGRPMAVRGLVALGRDPADPAYEFSVDIPPPK